MQKNILSVLIEITIKIRKEKNKMINSITLLEKMIEVIDGRGRRIIQEVVSEYGLNYGTQHFFGESHIKLLMFGQLSECESLREIVSKASNNEKVKRLVNVPSVSQFSRQNGKRDADFAEQLFYRVLHRIREKVGWKKFEKIKHNMLSNLGITVMDSSVVGISKGLAESLYYGKGRSGIRINTIYNVNQELPERVRITPRKESEATIKNTEALLKAKEIIALFDRGYSSYKLYDDLTNKRIRFVTRITAQKTYRVIVDRTEENDEISDKIVELGQRAYHTKHKYRLITFKNSKGEEIRLVTNLYRVPADTIIYLYKLRWEIEIFFKRIKQNLVIKKWYGYNENSMRIQIYLALICYLLVKMLAAESKIEYLKMKRIVQVNLLELTNYVKIFSG